MPSITQTCQRYWQMLTPPRRRLWLLLSVTGLLLLSAGLGWRLQHPAPLALAPQAESATAALRSPATPVAPAPSPASRKPYLGLRGKTWHQGVVQGVKILEVFADSPSARAGLPVGRLGAETPQAIIVAINEQPIRSEAELGQALSQHGPGTPLRLRLTDSGGTTSTTLAVTLAQAPEPVASAVPSTDTMPALPWPGGQPSLPAPGVLPVGWSERLLGVPVTAVGLTPALPPAGATDLPPDFLEAYMDKLDIMPVSRTRLVKIAFSTPDPELAARVANAHARAYLRQGLELRSRANSEALQFLEEKLADLKERVEKSEAALNRYRRDRGIISLDNRENIVVDRLADLNKRLTEAEADRIALEAHVRLIRKQEYDALPAVLDNRLVQTLKGDLARLEGEHADLATKFKPGYPELDQLRAKMEQTKRRLQQEIHRTVEGIKSAHAAAKQKEDELRTRMERQKTAALGLKDASVEYAILAREVDTNRQLYDSVLQRLKEMQVAAALRASNVSVIDPAVAPLRPARPNRKLSLGLGAVIGLIGGIGLAFFVEHLHNTLKTPQDVERYLHLQSLGMVPDFRRLARQPQAVAATAMAVQPYDPATLHPSFVLAHGPFSLVTEAYRALRTALLLTQVERPCTTLLVTSAVHGEGKTVTTVNTAAMLAQMGLRVLVIDADLRCASCHTVLGVDNTVGLAEVLTGQCTPEAAIQTTALGHLSVMSSGTPPPNPTELVASEPMRDTLRALQPHYDYILIDSPPVMPASDAVMLATRVDGVVLVTNARQTPRQVTRDAYTRLQATRATILGVVLNRLQLRASAYAYYYRHAKKAS